MGRPIEFDQQKVIDDIVKLFWERGYEATSMKNISDATGLQPGSLYAAFGSKRSLFLTAIDTYFEESIESLKAVLEGDGSPLQRVRELFMYIVGDSCHKDSHGCMLVNALLETPADDEELRSRIAKMFRQLERAIKKVLIEAAASGELDPEKDPAIQAKLLINNIYGLRVYGKLQPKASDMKKMVEDLMASLKLS
ncbi:MAG TPA: TetR/AcrR family transcriptional regulator [Chromatiales bacterium]|nr:TetR/AcrR family transcriptional regulator [Thiotrichales bacterium]HIP69054.1 TetR/AcrR family transcriptional regulator [Chromatiales bacterium]